MSKDVFSKAIKEDLIKSGLTSEDGLKLGFVEINSNFCVISKTSMIMDIFAYPGFFFFCFLSSYFPYEDKWRKSKLVSETKNKCKNFSVTMSVFLSRIQFFYHTLPKLFLSFFISSTSSHNLLFFSSL